MKKLIVPLLLIVLGLIVIRQGRLRSDSIAGISSTVEAKIANTWDGKDRQPDHVWYYVGGGIVIVAGIAVAARNNTLG